MATLTTRLGLHLIEDTDDANAAVKTYNNADKAILDNSWLSSSSRITADFSNATFAARSLFQTSTPNAATSLGAISNGTGTGAQFFFYGANDPTNAPYLRLAGLTTASVLESSHAGTGTTQPLDVRTDGSTRARFHVSGGISLLDSVDPGAGVVSLAGTLSLTGTARRIMGDFSNLTFANRTMVQSATANANTNLGLLPNGSALSAGLHAFGGSDPDNAPFMRLVHTGASALLTSGKNGGGVTQPMAIQMDGTTRAQFHVSGGVSLLDTADPGAGVVALAGTLSLTGAARRIVADFSAVTPTAHTTRASLQSSVANGQTALNVIPNGTATIGRLYLFGGSDAENAPFLQILENATSAIIDANKSGTGTQPVSLQLRMASSPLVTLHASLGLSLLDGTDPGAGVARVAGTLNVTTAIQKNGVALNEMMSGSLVGSTIPASTTQYFVPTLGSASTPEANRSMVMTRAGTARALYFVTSGAQPASGALVVTIRKNGAATAITLTVAAGAATGTFSDLAHAVAFAAGDLLSIELANAASAASAPITAVGFSYDL